MSEPLTRQGILQILRDGLREVAPDKAAAAAKVQMETELTALGVDSVGTMEMIAYVEDRLGIIVADERLAQGRYVSDLVELIHAQVTGHG